MRSILHRTVFAVALSVAVVTLAGCGGGASAPVASGTASGGSSQGSAAPVDATRAGDIMFAQMMIPHHRQAVEMGDIAAGKADGSAAVKTLGAQVKAAQAPEIVTMQKWLAAWGGAGAGRDAPPDDGHAQ